MQSRFQEVIARYKAFYEAPRGGLMVMVSQEWERIDSRQIPLNAIDWTDAAQVRGYAAAQLEDFRAHLAPLDSLDDDRIPGLQNLSGTGMIGAAFVRDAILHQQEETNYLEKAIKDWDRDLGRIGFDPENPWYQAMMVQLRYYIEQWRGDYSISPFTHFDPCDLANQFRENDIFMDFAVQPELLHMLLERATKALMELEDYTRAHYMHGYEFSGFSLGCWIPAGNYLSCDIGDMVSPAILEEFCLPYTQRVLAAWGAGFLHHHELGIHQMATWSRCRNLTVQFLNRDPNTRHLGQPGVLDASLLETTLRVPVYFIATAEEFMQEAARWADGKCIISVRCRAAEQAQEVLKCARAYRNY